MSAFDRRTLGKLVLGGVLGSTVPSAWAASRSGQFAAAPPPDFSVLAPGSRQVLLVTNAAYGQTRASVTGWSLARDGGWRRVLGPFDTAWIGGRGFARPGTKVEGDRRSPTGAFTLPLLFGRARPSGVALPWRTIDYPYDYWVDDPRSPYYNAYVSARRFGRAAMGTSNPLPRYAAAAGIGYNPRRVPGAGSALFIHPTHWSPTLGCVGLPTTQLVAALRWLRPQAQPRIVLGVGAELLRLAGGPLRPVVVRRPDPPPPTEPPPSEPAPSPSATPAASPSSSPGLPLP